MNTTTTSLKAYCLGAGITLKQYEDYNYSAPVWALEDGVKHYRVTLRYQRRTMSLWWYQSSGVDHAPNAWDILESLLADSYSADYSLDDYISELGYEIKSIEDYRNLVKIQKQVKRYDKALKRLLSNDDLFNAMREAI